MAASKAARSGYFLGTSLTCSQSVKHLPLSFVISAIQQCMKRLLLPACLSRHPRIVDFWLCVLGRLLYHLVSCCPPFVYRVTWMGLLYFGCYILGILLYVPTWKVIYFWTNSLLLQSGHWRLARYQCLFLWIFHVCSCYSCRVEFYSCRVLCILSILASSKLTHPLQRRWQLLYGTFPLFIES